MGHCNSTNAQYLFGLKMCHCRHQWKIKFIKQKLCNLKIKI